MDPTTASSTVQVTSELGLHAQPAMVLQDLAERFDCDITVVRTDGGDPVDGKSLLALLTLMLSQGTEIRIEATGPDAARAVETLDAFVRAGFVDESSI